MIEILLLLALPASGKSEVRRYLAHLNPERRLRDLRIGQTAQLDDFPYVHVMSLISGILRKKDLGEYFFAGKDQPWADQREWLTLVELLNEDFTDLIDHHQVVVPHAGRWLINRIEAASCKVGFNPRLAALPADVFSEVADEINDEAEKILADRNQTVQTPDENRTVVIEFARGGPEQATMPLSFPIGYKHSLAWLKPEILSRAAILYVWVTPEESRRKNRERTNPDDPGSILHHGVPEIVMLNEYGCDDIDWLEIGHPGIVRIDAHGKTWNIPLARFDNRDDKTSFLRDEPTSWPREKVGALHKMFINAMQGLNYK